MLLATIRFVFASKNVTAVLDGKTGWSCDDDRLDCKEMIETNLNDLFGPYTNHRGPSDGQTGSRVAHEAAASFRGTAEVPEYPSEEGVVY